jgi:hypothetical protein
LAQTGNHVTAGAETAPPAVSTARPKATSVNAPPPQAIDERAAAASWSSDHLVNIRVSIPVPFAPRYYLTIVAGKERRNSARRADERRKHPLWTMGNIAFFGIAGGIIGLGLLFILQLAGRYLLESWGMLQL